MALTFEEGGRERILQQARTLAEAEETPAGEILLEAVAAAAAAQQMVRQTGAPVFGADGLLRRGVIVRQLVLPGQRADSCAVLDWLANELPRGSFLLSLMSQYTPAHRACAMPGLNRRVSTFEYKQVVQHALDLGLDAGYMQERSSAKEEYTPPFDLQGV